MTFKLEQVTVLEMDLDKCANVYGVAPCTAAGAVGTECYNAFPHCQDPANFVKTTKTWKFCNASADVPAGQQIRPYIPAKGISAAPTEINLEKGLAPRAKVTVKLIDEPSTDIEADPYYATRPAEAQGSFFARLMARNRNYAGRFARLRTAYFTAGWDDPSFVDELYVIDKIDGPDSKAGMSVVLKDPIKLTDRAMVPAATSGVLLSDITDVSTTLSLNEDAGTDYTASGFVRIGDEIIKYTTNAADVLGGLTRAQFNTTAAAADAGDGVQLCKVYENVAPWAVLEDLLLSSGLSSGNIDSAGFEAEDDAWLGTGWEITTCLSEPEKASKHLAELVVQIGGFMWWDPATQKAIFRVLAPLHPEEVVTATLTDTDSIIEGSVKITVLEDLRKTLYQTWYDRISAVANASEAKSYSRLRHHVDASAEGANDYGDSRPDVVYSKWFTAANDVAVGTIAARRVGYYRDAPKNIGISVDAKNADIREGDYVDIETAGFTDVTGAPDLARCIALKRRDEGGRIMFDMRVLNFGARYAFIAPDATGDYPSEPEWAHIAPDSEVFDDGTPAYQVF